MSIAKTTRIVATSRSAVKIRDNFYTIEMTEERSIPVDAELSPEQLEKEKNELFNSVNATVDMQIEDIVNTFGKR